MSAPSYPKASAALALATVACRSASLSTQDGESGVGGSEGDSATDTSDEESTDDGASEDAPKYEPGYESCDGPPGRVIDIDSDAHTCVVFEGGQVECWGRNWFGVLGYGTFEHVGDDETPAEMGFVEVGGCVDRVDVGESTTCVVLRNGAVKCWGDNDYGQLGLPYVDNIGEFFLPSSQPAIRFSSFVRHVSTGYLTVCALLDEGEIYCWGNNYCGRLGYEGATSGLGFQPSIEAGEAVQQASKASGLDVSDMMNCLLDEERLLTCWGAEPHVNGHQPMQPEYGCDSVPAEAPPHYIEGPVLDITLGNAHACALDAEHELRCWNESGSGAALGYGQEAPVAFPDIPPIQTGGTVNDVDAGYGITCALYDGGRARCWGGNSTGALGQGHTELIGDDEVPADVPFIDVGEAITEISAGYGFVCALTVSGQVRCWGSNEDGQLGLGYTKNIGDNELPSSVPAVSLL